MCFATHLSKLRPRVIDVLLSLGILGRMREECLEVRDRFVLRRKGEKDVLFGSALIEHSPAGWV